MSEEATSGPTGSRHARGGRTDEQNDDKNNGSVVIRPLFPSCGSWQRHFIRWDVWGISDL